EFDTHELGQGQHLGLDLCERIHFSNPPSRYHSGAPRSVSPESIFQRPVFMDSGPRPPGDPGMTSVDRIKRAATLGEPRPATRRARRAAHQRLPARVPDAAAPTPPL